MQEQPIIRKARPEDASQISELISRVAYYFAPGGSDQVAAWFASSITPSAIAGCVNDPKFNLQTAVGCTRACPDGRARQGERTPRTAVRKDDQRRMVRPAGCDRVHSARTHLVTALVAKIVSIHARLQRNSSGQLPFVGSTTSPVSWGRRLRVSSRCATQRMCIISLWRPNSSAKAWPENSGLVRRPMPCRRETRIDHAKPRSDPVVARARCTRQRCHCK